MLLPLPREIKMQHKLLTPAEIAAQAGSKIPFLHLPESSLVFSDRAARLRQLAQGHAMAGYLEFIADVADEQQALLQHMPPVRLPSPAFIADCNEHAMPPLNFQTHARDPQWRSGLRSLLHALADRTSGRQHEVVFALERSGDELYEAQATKLLSGTTFGLDVAAAPLIAAAAGLFQHLRALGSGHRPIDVQPLSRLGSRPRPARPHGGNEAGYRFLHCALCSTNGTWCGSMHELRKH